jgi:hypothetical protein
MEQCGRVKIGGAVSWDAPCRPLDPARVPFWDNAAGKIIAFQSHDRAP